MSRRRWAVAGVTVLTLAVASPAQAVTYKQFGCTVSGRPGLHMTATRINYGGGKTAIYASATQRHKQIINNAPDIDWTFNKFTSSTGLQTRYSQPTQWGSKANPLPRTGEYVTVKWLGRNTQAQSGIPASCTTRVGY